MQEQVAARDELHLHEVLTFGRENVNGNLLGIQPYMVPADYAREDRFFAKLDCYFAVARSSGFLREKTVVVLPEYLGTWLVLANEPSFIHRTDDMKRAMGTLAVCHLPSFIRRYRVSQEQDRLAAALLRMKASATAALYQRIFAQLALRYQVHIVAGSLILPDPSVVDGVLVAGDGPLYNVSVVFAPDDGRPCPPPVRKIFPTAEEQPFLACGRLDDLPVFTLPIGRLGVLVCADAWYPACYQQMKTLQAEIIAVPSYGMNEVFTDLWPGYSGFPAPADVNQADIGTISRQESWRKYALEGRLALSGARAGLNVFLHGHLWQSTGSGQATAISGNAVHTGSLHHGASLINLWL